MGGGRITICPVVDCGGRHRDREYRFGHITWLDYLVSKQLSKGDSSMHSKLPVYDRRIVVNQARLQCWDCDSGRSGVILHG